MFLYVAFVDGVQHQFWSMSDVTAIEECQRHLHGKPFELIKFIDNVRIVVCEI